MFDFIPDFAITFLHEKHSKYVLGSLKMLLSSRLNIGKYEDKRILFLYCLVHAGHLLGLQKTLICKFGPSIQKYLFQNFFKVAKIEKNVEESSEKLEVAYFVGCLSYKNIEVGNLGNYLVDNEAIYCDLLRVRDYPDSGFVLYD